VRCQVDRFDQCPPRTFDPAIVEVDDIDATGVLLKRAHCEQLCIAGPTQEETIDPLMCDDQRRLPVLFAKQVFERADRTSLRLGENLTAFVVGGARQMSAREVGIHECNQLFTCLDRSKLSAAQLHQIGVDPQLRRVRNKGKDHLRGLPRAR